LYDPKDVKECFKEEFGEEADWTEERSKDYL